jgi:hypothetical protein
LDINQRPQLAAAREQLEKLMFKYLNDDPAILQYFTSMKNRMEDRISSIETQIAEAETAKATFDELLSFSQAMLVDIGSAWLCADVDQRQRVQTALFPRGLKFHRETGILNPDKDSNFSQLENFLGGNMEMVGGQGLEPRTSCV